jgi:hypothetical protein
MNWKILGASVRGASHDRRALPNQDAIAWWPDSREGPLAMLCIADGHGSALRADTGARFAVEVVLNTFHEFVANLSDPPDLTACKREAEERLPLGIERDWKKAVERHLEKTPLLPEEVLAFEETSGIPAKQKVERDPLSAYGTTFVSTLVTPWFVLCAQIGDGDLLVVSGDGTVERPIPDNPLHFANETTSLCLTDAWKNVQVHFQALADAAPVLFLLATDGYKNAHRSLDGFFRTAHEFADALRESGSAEVEGYLPELLTQASHKGSGDDVTVGLLWRTDAPPLPPLPSLCPVEAVESPPPPPEATPINAAVDPNFSNASDSDAGDDSFA